MVFELNHSTHLKPKEGPKEGGFTCTLPKAYDIALRLYEGGKYQDAEGIFLALINERVEIYHFWMGLGSVYQVQKKLKEAVHAYVMAAFFEKKEIDPFPHFHAAECLYLLGLLKPALEALQSANCIAEKDPEHYGLIENIIFLKERWTNDSNI